MISKDNIACDSCYFFEGKRNLKEGLTDWCWRFDYRTNEKGYCKSKYFLNKERGTDKHNQCAPQIVGYFKRKNDFDKNENMKLSINVVSGILGITIGVMLTYFLTN